MKGSPNSKFSIKNIFIDQATHADFRDYYTVKQVYKLFISAICAGIFGIIACICYSSYGLFEHKHVYIEFGYLIIISIISVASMSLLKHFLINSKKISLYYEIVSIAMAYLYLIWGVIALYFSIIDTETTNVLPILIIYTLCSMFFNYSVQHYISLFLFCCVLMYVEVVFLKHGNVDIPTLINVLVLGLLLTVGGITKYIFGLNEYKSFKKATNALESQKFFVNSMNHELRSPLNGILGLLDILYSDGNLTNSQRDYINKAQDSSKILLRIVNDLLDYAKLEAGDFPINKEEFSLKDLISNIKGNSIPLCVVKRLDFSIDVDENTPCSLSGDLIRIEQIIMNLISNSIKYTDIGFIKVNIKIENDSLIASVEDTGHGMTNEMMQNLYVPFKRDEANNKAIQGTGLGLAIVYRLLKQMGGSIDVSSEVEMGTTFTVNIPIEIIDNELVVGDIAEIRSNTTEKPNFSGKRILCVDDNNVNILVFKGLLKETGCFIDSALSGKAAIQLSQIYKYDIIFMDHMMPEMDGIETFKRIRNGYGSNRNTPVVALTANAGLEAESLYYDSGFDGYLPKPLERQMLYDTLFDLLYTNNSDDSFI